MVFLRQLVRFFMLLEPGARMIHVGSLATFPRKSKLMSIEEVQIVHVIKNTTKAVQFVRFNLYICRRARIQGM